MMALAAAAALPLACPAAVVEGRYAESVLENPDFEAQVSSDGVPSGWKFRGGQFSVAEGEGRNGTRAVKWDFASSPEKGRSIMSQRVRIKPGRHYRYEMWVRTENLSSGAHGASLWIDWCDEKGKYLGEIYPCGPKGTQKEWFRVAGITRRLPRDAAFVALMVGVENGTAGTAYFDDIRLCEVGEDPVASLLSDSYRDMAWEGDVTFSAALDLSVCGIDPKTVEGVFTLPLPDGRSRQVPAQSVASDRAVLTVPVSELAKGRNAVAFRLSGRDGRTLGTASLEFTRLDAPPRRRVSIDRHRRAVVDGKRFFPLGLYSGSLDASLIQRRWKDSPFNCIMPYSMPTPEQMDCAWTNGIMSFVSLKDAYAGSAHCPGEIASERDEATFVADTVAKFKDKPALLAWYVNDESDIGKAAKLSARRDLLERLDPEHPTWGVIYQVEDARGYAKTADVHGSDPYPVPGDIGKVLFAVRAMDGGSMGTRAVWQVPQIFDWCAYRNPAKDGERAPTEDEVRNMSWQSIAGGANGLVYYAYFLLERMDHKDPFERRWRECCTVAREIRDLFPLLLADPADFGFCSPVPERLGWRAWSHEGGTWVLFVNASRERMTARLSPTKPVGEVSPVFGNGEVALDGGCIDVDLPPIGVSIVRLKDDAAAARRAFRPERYSRGDAGVHVVQPVDTAAWVWPANLVDEIAVAPERYLRFRRAFRSPGGTARVDVSADERFVLLLDGRIVARGPNRGTVENWMYQTYDLDLPAGEHALEAVVWRIGEAAPLAQLSWRGGFILKAEGEFDALLSTGKAQWQVGELKGTHSDGSLERARSWGCGAGFSVRGTGLASELPQAWTNAVVVREAVRTVEDNQVGIRRHGWILFPSQLPDQTEWCVRPGAFKTGDVAKGAPFTVPPRTRKEILWDLENYYCAYPVLRTSGGEGARVTWGWSEAMREANGRKTRDRGEWQGKKFVGFTDRFLPDGRKDAEFTTPWWRCGRWVEIAIETADAPLTVEDVSIVESRYPVEDESRFECDDGTVAPIRRLCARGMQMCAHEMLFDCPFYEQQMYPGDSRVELRVLAAMSGDDRLVRRAIELFDYGRRESGLVPMNHPSRGLQESVTYSMCQLMMYADYVRYHANVDWLKARLPGLRHTVDAVAQHENEEGLLAALPGWSFVDWVPTWQNGNAPDGDTELPSAVNNFYWAMTLEGVADVERALGHEEMARLRERQAARTFAAAERLFWDEGRGLYADTVRHDTFSEHAQCLALACRAIAEERAGRVFGGLVSDPGLSRCTVYFSYYLFDTYFKFGRGDIFLKRLDLWRNYVRQDLKTPLESPDIGEREARSDCHAWGAHPLVFMQRGLAGVTSSAPFFGRVRVAPCPGALRVIRSRTPHPKGFVETDLAFDGDCVSGTVSLPAGVAGEFVWKGRVRRLQSGVNDL